MWIYTREWRVPKIITFRKDTLKYLRISGIISIKYSQMILQYMHMCNKQNGPLCMLLIILPFTICNEELGLDDFWVSSISKIPRLILPISLIFCIPITSLDSPQNGSTIYFPFCSSSLEHSCYKYVPFI